METTDEQWMRRAITVACQARGHAEPNPLVGCVIVGGDGEVIAEACTQTFGGPHAEAVALKAAGDRAAGATLYTTLEPCCYTGHGKKTPPCAPRIVNAKIRRVVVGCIDPNPHVAGNGNRQLQEAGLDVASGVCEDEAKQLLAPFIATMVHKRPYVTLKWAVSSDGKVAGKHGQPVRISNPASTAAVHRLRGRCDAIAVGTNTVKNDDPLLTARTDDPPRTPLRVIFSNSLQLGQSRRLLEDVGEPVLIYTVENAAFDSPDHVELIRLPAHDNGRGGVRFSMIDALADLHRRSVTHLLIEPGPKLAREMIERNQSDRILTIRGQHAIGDDGLDAPIDPYPPVHAFDLEGDTWTESLNPNSDVYFGPFPSPDVRLLPV